MGWEGNPKASVRMTCFVVSGGGGGTVANTRTDRQTDRQHNFPFTLISACSLNTCQRICAEAAKRRKPNLNLPRVFLVSPPHPLGRSQPHARHLATQEQQQLRSHTSPPCTMHVGEREIVCVRNRRRFFSLRGYVRKKGNNALRDASH